MRQVSSLKLTPRAAIRFAGVDCSKAVAKRMCHCELLRSTARKKGSRSSLSYRTKTKALATLLGPATAHYGAHQSQTGQHQGG